ncbi:MAG: sugar transferase, partial [Anaerolineales bacterium]
MGDLIKRGFDVVVSSIVLVLLAPFIASIAAAIKRDSPGPVFFHGKRIGRGGKYFNILKFRTMHENPESYAGPRVTALNDPRVTRTGRWLRDTKLNELPQFWNVLKGEMSLVGPRPEDPTIAKTWPREAWQEILSVRPGITSPASVQYRNEEQLLSTGNLMQTYFQELGPDKMRMDQLYVRNRSFWLDMDVILWTALIMLPKIRHYTFPEELIFIGPTSRLTRRYTNWFAIDFLVTLLAIGFTGFAFRASHPLDVGWPISIAVAVGFALLFSLTGILLGVNRVDWSKATNAEVFDLLPAWILATAIAYVANYFMQVFPSSLILMASCLALIGFVFVRYRNRLFSGFLYRALNHQRIAQATREHVLIIGTGPTAQVTAWLLEHPQNAGKFWVAGFVDDDIFKHGTRIYGSEVVGGCHDLSKIVEKYDVGV